MNNNTYIGIDLGTSGVKILLVAADGEILSEVSESYPVFYPQPGWSEQNPDDWLKAVKKGLKRLFDGGRAEPSAVKGFSFGGQMHGLVALDKYDNVIRPCILWNDGRAEKQTDYLNEVVGQKRLTEYTGNIAFAGFTAPKILWLKETEPENFSRIEKIMLPKDYLAYKLTGVFCTDQSDASGTLLLDVKERGWSKEMCEICGISESMLPKLFESYEVVGRMKAEYGFPNAVVTAGAGDNAAAAIGTGTIGKDACNISLGTSGTIFLSDDRFSVDNKNALHSFCHADGKWHLMGCILTAAFARKWWLEDILRVGDYAADEEEIRSSGSGGPIFLPYLTGERSPHNDVNAKGAFIGLTATTTKGQMSKAVMEGVAFALRDCLEAGKANGVIPSYTSLCGGGAKSRAWRQIVADVLDLPVRILETEQGPAYGAAMLAMVGAGEYKTVEEAARKLVRIKERIRPNAVDVKRYNKKYGIYKKLYPMLKEIFTEI